MCAPALPALAIASAVVGAVGTGVGAIQKAGLARYQAAVADQNAQLDRQQQAMADENTRTQVQRYYQKQGQLEGQQVAAMSANGIDPGFGTALSAQEDTKAIGAQDVDQIYRQGAQTALGYDIDAANQRDQATAARAQASGALVAGAFGVMSTALGGASQYSSLKAKLRGY